MKWKKKINTLIIFVMFSSLVLEVSGCGNAKTDSVPKTDTESDTQAARDEEAGAESEAESDEKTEEAVMGQKEEENIYQRSSTVGDVISDPYFEDSVSKHQKVYTA